MAGRLRAIAAVATAAGAAVFGTMAATRAPPPATVTPPGSPLNLPSRKKQWEDLQSQEYDILVIGGGATGSGVALDAASRGLRVALVERDDFCSGTSSRSTKLIHGGVRYLEKAIMQLDMEQYNMVQEALRERETLLRIAPHVARELPILVPIYRWWELPYMYAGLKMYDFIAWLSKKKEDKGVSGCYMLGRDAAMAAFPQLNTASLRGAIVYHDGQHDDAAMGLAVALTAAKEGATVLNHAGVVELVKQRVGEDVPDRIIGARVRDELTGEEATVHAKCVINATGCFTDEVLKMDNPKQDDVVVPSQGIHVVLPSRFCPRDVGMLEPSSSDGRVLFFLPWEGRVVAGTTDSASHVSRNPKPNQKDVDFIIRELNKKLSPDVQIQSSDVRAAWSGLRPLVKKPDSTNTESLPRTHFVHVSSSGLVTIAGGKWTTYRQMAEDAVEAALKERQDIKPSSPSRTREIFLVGGERFTPTLAHRLVALYNIDIEVATHLATRYGDKAFAVLDIDPQPKLLVDGFPYIENEVVYTTRAEYARTPEDVLARRLRLAFLDNEASHAALGRVTQLMAKELGWSAADAKRHKKACEDFLDTMIVTPHDQAVAPPPPPPPAAASAAV
ncbi:glycerol-3-phosphate dehydrogenase [Salpingoeca rosetta]|uniref:Glycerol-3-phosphate dehydrogenase n=1 Tax=Salpingoeca rosetta (strain ATCC 50818 / BSB-021) TaxID=946362 RepID=F2U7E2_SALR5|nr:glycerol-3-phosphate dehydrogenase [Salpingoeca rosetta]EGD83359.1 glycerol-3-phosphate dehydrogenase [Salpingoeca rosetta]|eukprot:XP_004994863.1 glycerol-3-phosphate dehydrogenase [Salpingoeca rosetta]